MDIMLYAAAILLVAIGIAHSYLGEKYILIRLFRRDNLPKLFGGTQYTKNTLRFAWHITTIAWFGFAAIVISLTLDELDTSTIGYIAGATFFFHFIVSLCGSKAKHFSWPVFLLIALALIFASYMG